MCRVAGDVGVARGRHNGSPDLATRPVSHGVVVEPLWSGRQAADEELCERSRFASGCIGRSGEEDAAIHSPKIHRKRVRIGSGTLDAVQGDASGSELTCGDIDAGAAR